MLAQTGVDKGDVGHDGQHEREADEGRPRHVEAGNDTRQVHGQNTEEDGREQGQESASVLTTQQVFRDVDANEVKTHLDEALESTGNNLHAPRAQPEQQYEKRGHQEPNQDDAVDLKGSASKKDGRREKLVDRGTDEAALRGCLGEQSDSVT